jgi:hypothetical protein
VSPDEGDVVTTVGLFGPEVVLNGRIPTPVAMPSTAITVKNTDGSAAALYTSATGTTTTGTNVVSTDGRGQLAFYAAPGYYDLAYADAVGSQTLRVEVKASAAYVAQPFVQSAESTPKYVFTITPKTAGYEDFQVLQNSFANTGAGAGTYNHTVHIGWNAARHGDSSGAITAGKPAVYMGFEDNYYDASVDLQYGVEWYTGYISPNGTTVAVGDLRPLYWRVTDSTTNTTTKDVTLQFDIGSGTGGSLIVWGSTKSGTQLLSMDHSQNIFFQKVSVLGSVQATPLAGNALMLVQSATATNGLATVQWGVNGSVKWLLEADQFGEIYLYDNNYGRVHANFLSGGSVSTAVTDLASSLKIQGDVGFYGAAPGSKPTVTGSKGGNAALGSLLNALAGLGLLTDSST